MKIDKVMAYITMGEPYNGYLIFQGSLPEVEEYIKRHHK